MPYLLRVWLYVSPVLYYADEMPQQYRFLLDVNPLGQLLAAWSDVINLGQAPTAHELAGRRLGVGVRLLRRRRSSSSSRGSVSSLSGSSAPSIVVAGRLGHLPDVVRAPPDAARHGPAPGPRARSVVREIEAVKDVSFEVPHGTVLGIVGANGAGKSTLVRTIAGILPPTDGRHRRLRPRQHAAGARRRLQPEPDRARQRPARRAGRRAQREQLEEKYEEIVRVRRARASSWTCRCAPTARACTGGWRSRSRSTWIPTSC